MNVFWYHLNNKWWKIAFLMKYRVIVSTVLFLKEKIKTCYSSIVLWYTSQLYFYKISFSLSKYQMVILEYVIIVSFISIIIRHGFLFSSYCIPSMFSIILTVEEY